MSSIVYRVLHLANNRNNKSLSHLNEMESISCEESKSDTEASDANKSLEISKELLQEKLKRVTRKDIACVTKEDIEALKTPFLHDRPANENKDSCESSLSSVTSSNNVMDSIDLERLRLSMEYLLQSNKFVDVLVCASSDTWKEAASDLTFPQLRLFDNLVQTRWGYLHSVLPFINTEFLEVMREYLDKNTSMLHSTA